MPVVFDNVTHSFMVIYQLFDCTSTLEMRSNLKSIAFFPHSFFKKPITL